MASFTVFPVIGRMHTAKEELNLMNDRAKECEPRMCGILWSMSLAVTVKQQKWTDMWMKRWNKEGEIKLKVSGETCGRDLISRPVIHAACANSEDAHADRQPRLGSDRTVRYIYPSSDEVVLFCCRSEVEEGPQCTSCVSNHCSHCREITNREFNMHACEHTLSFRMRLLTLKSVIK